MIYLILILSGAIITWLKIPAHNKYWYGNYVSENEYLLVNISSKPVLKNKTWKVEGTINAIIDNKVKPSFGALQLYWREDSNSIQYGQCILIKSAIQEFPANSNPGAFDYKSYMARHGLYHRLRIRKNGYLQVGNERSFFLEKLNNSREYSLGILQKCIPGNRNISMAEALMLGYKDDLDQELIQAYSNAGVIHIIAISGLHLGFIYLLLQKILSIIPFIRRNKIIVCIIILAGLWFFTILTGSAPSALRSAVMFTFIVTGKSFYRQYSIYNALCASAFFLLCFDPNLLTDPGFQLSYLAVISIVWLQRPVNKLFYFKNKPLEKLWSLISVSLVAQLLTTPISIYYFHQFPNYFLLSNLVAVPVSTVILFGCIFVVCTGWIPLMASFSGKAVSVIIAFLNWFITGIDNLPNSLSRNIAFSISATVLMYLAIIFFILWFYHHFKLTLPAFLLILFLLSLNGLKEQLENRHQSKLIVYNVPGYSAIDYISKKHAEFYGDSEMLAGKLKQQYLDPSRLAYHISDYNNFYTRSFIKVINNKLIVRAAQKIQFKSKCLPVDILIISHNGAFSIYDLVPSLQPRLVIFDSSSSLWKIDKWINECEQLHLPYYSVARNGAYIDNVN